METIQSRPVTISSAIALILQGIGELASWSSSQQAAVAQISLGVIVAVGIAFAWWEGRRAKQG